VSFASSARRIAPLAWPVFVGQVAVLGFSTVDTLFVARSGALDLAALAIGSAAYISIFVGLMGVVLAIGPIAGQLYGAQRLEACGAQLHQAMWLALALALPGCALLLFPEPFFALAHAKPEVAERARGYLNAIAFALPFALLFTAFRGFNTAVSRPKVVMALQLGSLLLKVPLTALLVFGAPALHLPPLGAAGCGIATAVCMVGQTVIAWIMLRRDPFYAPFGLHGAMRRPDRASLMALLRLGLPMGGSIMVEVTGFTFMAFFIARLGTTSVAGHQIAINLVSLMFMMPLAIANASSTLVAQRIGADDLRDARRIGWHGVQLALVVAAAMGAAVYALRGGIVRIYTGDAAVIAAALPLLAWVAVFHIADAAQTVAAFVLRAWRIATVPLVIYVLAIWGVGLGGGYTIAFDSFGWAPAALQGAQGFWSAATVGLVVAGSGMSVFLLWMLRQQRAAVA
jgi:MATE family multidrug resistance protein